RPRLHGHVLNLDDLLRVRVRKRAAEDGKVLGEHKYGPAIHGPPTGDDAIAGDLCVVHAELGRAVFDEHVELLERALVHEQLDTLARRELAALVLRLDARLATAFARIGAAAFKFVDD